VGQFFTAGSGVGDIEIDADGNLYVPQSIDDRVDKYTPTGELLGTLSGESAGPGGLLAPNGVAVGEHGRLYVTDAGPMWVKLFTPKAPFGDVPLWVDEQVGWLAYHDYMTGFADNTFRTGDPITRAQAARVLYRIAGEPDVTGLEHDLTDVPAWVDAPVRWLVGNGHMTGFADDTFRAGDPITRGQAARVFYRIAGEPDVTGLEHGLADVPAWVDSPVRWLVANGHMTGFADETFRPAASITRGQAANATFNVYA
jgi:hypothetical protein